MTAFSRMRARFTVVDAMSLTGDHAVRVRLAGGRGTAGHLLRQGYEYCVFYGLLAIFAVTSLAFSFIAAILAPLLPRRLGQPLGRWLIMAGCRYFVGMMQASGIITCDLAPLDRLRRQGPLVIAANHPALLDVVLLASRLPRVVCTAKAGLLNNFFVGASARLGGYIRNDATTPLVREGIRQLGCGGQLLIFPEGTRSSAGRIGPFKAGFALMAQRAGAPIQTVFIESNSHFLGKGWPLWRKPAFPLSYRVRLGPVLAVEGDFRQFVTELQQFYRRALDGKIP
jgi:1-acyl-sn-glycerol-3-phosphate acyltransferase